MPKTILTDSPVRKDDTTKMRVRDIQSPDVSAVLYGDAHQDAGRGLYLKVEKSGKKTWVLTYYRQGKRHLKKLGEWPHMKPAEARITAGKERDALKDKSYDPIPARWSVAKQEKRKAEKAARMAKNELTLGGLLLAYVEQLKHDGKYSARAVENSLRKHVERAFPDKWKTPADELVMADFKEIIGKLTKAGSHREAGKVRAYLRAAYVAGIDAERDASVVPELQKFKLSTNPVRDLKVIKKRKTRRADRKDEEEGTRKKLRKPLTLPELRLYYQRIKAMPTPEGAILNLHLLTGGQRMEQLRRLTVNDLDTDEDVVTFYDPKGRREEERPHEIPLIPEAVEALEAIGQGPNLVSYDGGKTQAVAWDISRAIKAVGAEMLAAGEVTEMFTGKTIRSTVETRLAAAGVDIITRAYLQSHGLGGVQATSYDFHSYMPEKLAALETLYDLLNADTADVVPMRRKAK
jgi:hypothetical protein